MNVIRVYKYSLSLPIIFPLLSLLFLYLFEGIMPSGLTDSLCLVVYSGILGGLPYIILAASLLFWMRGKTELQITIALLLSPILMVIIFAVCFALIVFYFVLINGVMEGFSLLLIWFGVLAMFTLIFGYKYVFLVLGVVTLFRAFALLQLQRKLP